MAEVGFSPDPEDPEGPKKKKYHMEIKIKFSRGRSDSVTVYAGDSREHTVDLARDFVKRHRLKCSSINVIASYMQDTIDNHVWEDTSGNFTRPRPLDTLTPHSPSPSYTPPHSPSNSKTPPSSRSISPLPHSISPLPHSTPPLPHSISPLPHSISPLPHSISPLPHSISPLPHSISPLPHTLPPTPDSLSPFPDSISPLPHTLPPTPDSLSPFPDSPHTPFQSPTKSNLRPLAALTPHTPTHSNPPASTHHFSPISPNYAHNTHTYNTNIWPPTPPKRATPAKQLTRTQSPGRMLADAFGVTASAGTGKVGSGKGSGISVGSGNKSVGSGREGSGDSPGTGDFEDVEDTGSLGSGKFSDSSSTKSGKSKYSDTANRNWVEFWEIYGIWGMYWTGNWGVAEEEERGPLAV